VGVTLCLVISTTKAIQVYIDANLLNRQYVECTICGITKEQCNTTQYYGHSDYICIASCSDKWYGDGDKTGDGKGNNSVNYYYTEGLDAKSIY